MNWCAEESKENRRDAGRKLWRRPAPAKPRDPMRSRRNGIQGSVERKAEISDANVRPIASRRCKRNSDARRFWPRSCSDCELQPKNDAGASCGSSYGQNACNSCNRTFGGNVMRHLMLSAATIVLALGMSACEREVRTVESKTVVHHRCSSPRASRVKVAPRSS